MKSNFGKIAIILGFLCLLFGLADFLGMFFHYDLTGVAWSPLLSGAVGSFLIKWGEKQLN